MNRRTVTKCYLERWGSLAPLWSQLEALYRAKDFEVLYTWIKEVTR